MSLLINAVQSIPNVKHCILEGECLSFWYILFQCFWISYIFSLSNKYSNFVCLLFLSYPQYSNELDYVIYKILTCKFYVIFSLVYREKDFQTWCCTFFKFLICFHTFWILLALLYFKVNTFILKQRRVMRCFYVIVLF